MENGIRVELEVEDPESCPVVSASRRTDQPITTISWSGQDETAVVTEEFTTDSDVGSLEDAGIETVFETGSHARHRFTRHQRGCVCQTIERRISPVETVRADESALTVSFYALDVDEVSDVVTTLREEYETVRLQRLQRADGSDGESADGDLVWVDRDALTERQQEVLETAHELGYFEYPREANATEVAEAIGIAPSTFSEHLAAAQSKILDAVVVEANDDCR